MKTKRFLIMTLFVLHLLISSGCNSVNYSYLPDDHYNPGIWKCNDRDIWFNTEDRCGHINIEGLNRDMAISFFVLKAKAGKVHMYLLDKNGFLVYKDDVLDPGETFSFEVKYNKRGFVLKPSDDKTIAAFGSDPLEFTRLVATEKQAPVEDSFATLPTVNNGKGIWTCQELDLWFDTGITDTGGDGKENMKGHLKYGEYDENISVSFDPSIEKMHIYFPDKDIERKDGSWNNVYYTFRGIEYHRDYCVFVPREDNSCNELFHEFKTLTFVRTEKYDD